MSRLFSRFFTIILLLSYSSSIHSSEFSSSEFDLHDCYESADFDEGYESTNFDDDVNYDGDDVEEEEEEEENEQYPKGIEKTLHKTYCNKNIPDSNMAMATLEAGPSALVANCVNAISGDFIDSFSTITIPGPQPIVVQCSYCSSEKEWNFQHMPDLEVGKSEGKNHIYARYLDDSGSGITYRNYADESYPNGTKGNKFTIPSVLFEKGLTNCGSGEISGQSNWRNSHIKFEDKKKDKHYRLCHGSHIERIFTKYKHGSGGDGTSLGKFHLEKEIHPNGNQLLYSYDKEKRLFHISAVNKLNKSLGVLGITYQTEDSSKWTSHNTNVTFRFDDKNHKRIGGIIPFHGISVGYSYDSKTHRLIKKSLPDSRFLEIKYYKDGDPNGRVSSLHSPKGVTHTFYYDNAGCMTSVCDAEQNVTQYCYHKKNKRLGTIARYDNKKNLLSKDSFYWSYQKNTSGNLIARTFEDAGKTYFSRVLGYDDFNNIAKDQLFGNLTGKFQQPLTVLNGNPTGPHEVYTKTYEYSQDGWNLHLEENDGRKCLSCSYYPRTNLLEHRFTKSDNTIIKREFFEYDENGVVVNEIWDDGQSPQKEDLSNVTERHAKITTPRTQWLIGLPEIVEERYWDFASSQYLLLKKTVNLYSDQGKLIKEDHFGSDGKFAYSLKWDYNKLGNIKMKIDALNQVTYFDYDDNGNKICEKGPREGWYKEYTYDSVNCLTKETEVWPDGSTYVISHRYNELNQRIATTNAFGHETLFEYNALGQLTKTQSPPLYTIPNRISLPFEKTEYDALGNAIVLHDAKGHVTECAYTIRGKPYCIKYPDGSRELKEYSLDGLLVKEIAKNGLTTTYTLDHLGRITDTVISDSEGKLKKKTTSTYSTFQLLSETDEQDLLTTYKYDGAGRRLSMKKGDHLTQYEYDELGRTNKIIESIDETDSRITCKTYDFLNRVIEEHIEDCNNKVFKQELYTYDADGNRTSQTTFTDAGCAKTETEYNPEGKPLSITDALGNKTLFFYDHKFMHKGQRVLKITKVDPLGNQEIKIHDTHGNVCCHIQLDPFGSIIQKEYIFYDALGHKTLSQNAVYQGKVQKRLIETAWEYDSMGNMTCSVEARGTREQKIIRHDYNTFGQKKCIQMPNGVSILNEYDGFGRLSTYKSTNNNIHYSYTYDIKDNPIEVKDLLHNTSTKRSYDEYNRLKSETLDNGLDLNYDYDRLGRTTTVILPDDSSINYCYNAHQLAAVERIKDNQTVYTHNYNLYDPSDNVLEETLLGQAGKIRYSYDLLGRPISVSAPHWQEYIPDNGFDAVGNLLKRNVLDKHGDITYRYTYDSLYQLNSENGFIPHTYENDSVYNRVEKDKQPYLVNALNQLESQTDSTYLYDDNGNLFEKNTVDEKCTYKYDALDRLIEVHNGSDVTTYAYDSFHRRLSKICNGVKTQYFYHNQNEIGAYREGKITQLRVLGLSYGAEIGASISFELDGNTYAPVHDPLGNVVVLLNEEGNLVENYSYTAFGEMQALNENAVDNPWMYSSKRLDKETGFIYFGRRYYASDIGRWITPDPAGYADGPNLYAYVHNHPLAYIDPDGQLAFLLVPFAISLAIDLCLPTVITCVEPYVGVVAASFLTGLANGYNLSFDPTNITDPTSLLCQQAGMGVGALLNINPAKAASSITKNVTKLGTAILQKEAVGTVMNAVATKATKVFNWCKPCVPIGQVTQKTAQAAEKCLTNNVANCSKQTCSRKITELEGKVSEWLGKDSRMIKNKAGDLVILSKDMERRVRFDFLRPYPHNNPHMHLENLIKDRWKGPHIYPANVPHN